MAAIRYLRNLAKTAHAHLLSFLFELKRRRVVKIGIAYLASAWLGVQIVESLIAIYGLPAQYARIVVVLLAIGFPATLILAWIYQFTSKGLKLDTGEDLSDIELRRHGSRLDRSIIVVLVIALGYFAIDKYLVTGDSPREDLSIVVLPFTSVGGSADSEEYADGITEELIDSLTQIPELRVIARDSSFAYADSELSLREIADELEVSFVLSGSVRNSDGDLRIPVRLVDPYLDQQIWSETYTGSLASIFDTQVSIANNVVGAMPVKLGRASVRSPYRTDPIAYGLFLKARQYRLQGTPEALDAALDFYQQAIDIDPKYPPAWEGFAEIHVFRAAHGIGDIDEGFRVARHAINNALDIDPNFAVAIAGLGWVSLLYDRDIQKAADYIERAMSLDPFNPDILSPAVYLHTVLGKYDKAIALTKIAIDRDPLGPIGYFELAGTQRLAGRPTDAEASAKSALQIQPDSGFLNSIYGYILLDDGRTQQALEMMEREVIEPFRLEGLAAYYSQVGETGESDRYLTKLIERYSYGSAYRIAAVYARRGQVNEAFSWIEIAQENREASQWISLHPTAYKSLHSDPRWEEFLTSIGKTPERLASIEFSIDTTQWPAGLLE